MKQKVLLSWSGGKDSALSFYEISCGGSSNVEIVALLTTLTEGYDRISMHRVRRELLLRQSKSLGTPAEEVWIPRNATNQIYEERFTSVIQRNLREAGVVGVVFGDLFLRDIREYRETLLQRIGGRCLFPLWGKDTKALANFFVERGFKAVVCCVDPRRLGAEFCGRQFDRSFLEEIPNGVDPCGENGEFHTFVYDGPIFIEKIGIRVGDVVERDGFCFADILPE